MAPKVERILENFVLAEGPHWDVATQNLYLVDIFEKSVHRFDPTTKSHYQAVIGTNTVSLIIPVEGRKDQYIITSGSEVALITWDGKSSNISQLDKLASLPGREVRFNDGKADPQGRLWSGTMGIEGPKGEIPPNAGTFYSFEKGKFRQHFEEVHISNGLAWNPSIKKMYYIDSGRRTVDQFDYDAVTGTISNRQPIFTLGKHNIPGFPDGQTIDADGNLWVAVFNGSRIIKIDPRKPETLLETIEIPAPQVTSVIFGGPELNELYVTTGRIRIEGQPTVQLEPPVHGGIYRVTGITAKGLPGWNIKL